MTASDVRRSAVAALFESYRDLERTAWIEATGPSMEPLIPAGSRLLVDFGRQPHDIGQIMVFRQRGELIAHRLVHRRDTPDGPRLVAKGDAEAFLDPLVAQGDVLGVVRRVRFPDGRIVALERGKRRAAVMAGVSGWSGRAAGAGARLTRRLPAARGLRAGASSGVVGLSRVPTRVVSAVIPRTIRGRVEEGGETNGVREPGDPRDVFGG